MKKAIHIALTLSIMALLAMGCSGRGTESATAPDVPDLSTVAGSADSQRMLWGMWNIHFDTAELTATIEPIRNAKAHFNITDMLLPPACDDCLEC
jgi:multidrug efflux pump subunit AcrA (membrane-fusion protein)